LVPDLDQLQEARTTKDLYILYSDWGMEHWCRGRLSGHHLPETDDSRHSLDAVVLLLQCVGTGEIAGMGIVLNHLIAAH